MNVVLWGYIEQNIFRGMHALLQYSVNPTEKNGCRNYAGVGLIFHYKQTVGGFLLIMRISLINVNGPVN